MTPDTRALLSVVALLGLVAQGWAQAAKPEEIRTKPAFAVLVDLRCLSLPRVKAIPIVRRLRSTKPEEVTKAVAELDDLVLSGEARLAGWPMITTFNGQKGVAEQVEELRYATEFQPVVSNVYVTETTGDLQQKVPAIKSDFEPTASAFETRNTGVTLEVEPTVDLEGKSVQLSFVAQHVRLLAVERVTVERQSAPDNRSTKTIVEQPRFTTVRVQTDMSFESGQPKLISVAPLPDGDQIELMILSAEITKTSP
jgi:hypothetical protein